MYQVIWGHGNVLAVNWWMIYLKKWGNEVNVTLAGIGRAINKTKQLVSRLKLYYVCQDGSSCYLQARSRCLILAQFSGSLFAGTYANFINGASCAKKCLRHMTVANVSVANFQKANIYDHINYETIWSLSLCIYLEIFLNYCLKFNADKCQPLKSA